MLSDLCYKKARFIAQKTRDAEETLATLGKTHLLANAACSHAWQPTNQASIKDSYRVTRSTANAPKR